MGEFFCGWRRKVGSVTLLLACLFMGGWVRSQFVGDVVQFKSVAQDSLIILASADQLIIFVQEMDAEWRMHLPELSFMDPKKIQEELRDESIEWHWRRFGIRCGERRDDMRILIVSYWSAVAPLTLLSTYLLLIKPRVVAPWKIAGPTPVDGM